MPIKLVRPIRISVPWMAGPIPPFAVVAVRKFRLSCGAPLTITSKSILTSGVMAITTHAAQRTKNRRFLNFLKR
jgi:hypothetical protein